MNRRLSLEVVTETALVDLSKGEADIALRTGKPHQPDLIARQVGTLELGLFASKTYIAEYGAPAHLGELSSHSLVGPLASARLERFLAPTGLRSHDIVFRSNSMSAQVGAIVGGLGIGAVLTQMADTQPSLVRLLPNAELYSASLWVVRRQEQRADPAVRAVFDAIVTAFDV